MNHKLEYVVSGTSYMRLSNPKIAGDEVNSAIVNDLLIIWATHGLSHTTTLCTTVLHVQLCGHTHAEIRPFNLLYGITDSVTPS